MPMRDYNNDKKKWNNECVYFNNPGIADDRISSERRGDEDARCVRPRLQDRLPDGVEDGDLALEARAPAAGRHAGDDLGAVGQHLLRVEAAGRARDALHQHPSVLVDEDAHVGLSFLW